jgi:membrane-associated phospholipid phosphatase
VPAAGLLVAGFALAAMPLAVRAGAWIPLAALVAAVLALAFSRDREARRWLPLVVAPLLYFTLPDLMLGWAGGEVQYRDPAVIGWERALFGGDPARELYRAVSTCLVSEPLHAAYLSYYALIFVPPLVLWRRGDREGVQLAATALAIAFVASYATFVAFPVQGPRYLWPDQEGICGGPVRALVLVILEGGSSRGAAFPSSHVAVAVAQAAIMTFRRLPHAWVVWALTAGLALGAVYGGFHYAIDALAGGLLGLAAAAVAVAACRSHRQQEG